MKKNILFLCFLFSINIFGQSPRSFDLPTITPPAPFTKSFERYGEIPVGYSTGVPNIQIPFFTIQTGKLQLPINISYHSAGNKVNDIPSPVGLGWSLNAGGMISRSIIGLVDEESMNLFGFNGYRTEADLGQGFNDYAYTPSMASVTDAMDRMHSNLVDVSSDRFTFNFNGRTGVFRKNVLTNELIQVPYSPLKITKKLQGDVLMGFEIVDEGGTIYEFAAREFTTGYGSAQSGTTGWYLTKIRTADNLNEIAFKYKQGEQIDSKGITDFFEIGMAADEVSVDANSPTYWYDRENKVSEYSRTQTYSFSITPLLDAIVYKEGRVQFNYALDRLDQAKTRLTSVTVIDSLFNNEIKKIDLYHSYLGNANANYRLLLDNIAIGSQQSTNKDKYSFLYNTLVQLPNYVQHIQNETDYFHEDYWGYFNGTNQWSSMPNEFASSDLINRYNFQWDENDFRTGNRNPDSNFIKAGLLTSIVYPTGGKTIFDFEMNEAADYSYASHHFGGGLRIRAIKNYDKNNDLLNTKRYEYQDGMRRTINKDMFSYIVPCFYSAYHHSIFWELTMVLEHQFFTSSPFFPLFGNGGVPVAYKTVFEYIDSPTGNSGYTKYMYDVEENKEDYEYFPFQFSPYANHPRFCAPYHYDYGNYQPRLILKEQYARSNNQYNLIKDERYTFQKLREQEFITGMKVDRRRLFMTTLNGYGHNQVPHEEYFFDFLCTNTKAFETVTLPLDNTIITYTDGQSIYHSTRFVYDPVTLQLVEKKEYLNGGYVSSQYKYPKDFGSLSPYSLMVEQNILNPIVEESIYRNANILYCIKNNYSSSLRTGIIVPETIEYGYKQSVPEVKVRYSNYDIYGNALSFRKEDDIIHSVIYGYKGIYPIAEVQNANYSEIAFSGFEGEFEDSYNKWIEGGGMWFTLYDDQDAPEGRYCMGMHDNVWSGFLTSQNLNLSSQKKYVLSFWEKGGSIYISTSHVLISDDVLFNQGDWRYRKIVFTGVNGSLDLSYDSMNDCFIDALRLCPIESSMQTFTYDPLIGVTSVSDPNGKISYYEYDGLGRLHIVRDHNRNILRSICYGFDGQPIECGGVYFNEPLSLTLNRNNCGVDQIGSVVTYFVPGDKYQSLISQADADQQAQSEINLNAQSYVNANGTCTQVYYNIAKSEDFTRTNCRNATGGQITYIVPARKYNSTLSQDAADELAQNEIDQHGQSYANINGTCSIYYSQGVSGNYYSQNCTTNYAPNPISINVPADAYSSTLSQADADSKALQYAQHYANSNGNCYLKNDVNLNFVNFTGYGYWTIQFVNISTYETFLFNTNGEVTATIGAIPSGTYDVTFSSSYSNYFFFDIGCSYGQSNFSGITLYGVSMSPSCSYIEIYL